VTVRQAYELAVTSTLLGAPELPDWYLGTEQWAAGLATAYFALLIGFGHVPRFRHRSRPTIIRSADQFLRLCASRQPSAVMLDLRAAHRSSTGHCLAQSAVATS
jgi:hypothetical protein